MRIIILGLGEVGIHLSLTLSEKGHDVTIIESNEAIACEIDETQNIKVIVGDGSSIEILAEANSADCDFFLAMTSDDKVNLVSTALAKALGAKTTIARIHERSYKETSFTHYQMYQVQFGIDYIVNPEKLCAVEIAKIIRDPHRISVESFSNGEIEVQQIEIPHDSKILGRSLCDLHLGKEVRLAYIERESSIIMPTAKTIFIENDLATFVGAPNDIFDLKQKAGLIDIKGLFRIALYGGTETAVALARFFRKSRFKVRIIEKDKELCKELAKLLPHTTIINADATSLRTLEEEQIGDGDYFIACTKDDENNIMSCMLARKLGVQHVQAIINKTDYIKVLDSLNEAFAFDLIISPGVQTQHEVLSYIAEESYIELSSLPYNAGKIFEVKIAETSQCVGKKIMDLNLPQGVVILVLMHKFHTKVPSADDVILHGDKIVVVSSNRYIDEMIDLLT